MHTSSRYHKEYAKLWTEKQTGQSKVEDLSGQISNLNNQNTVLHQQNINLKADISEFIAALDILLHSDMRVFTCRHKQLGAIPDGQNSSTERTEHFVTKGLLQKWETDAEFMSEYNIARQCMLDHHRAHERVNQGRGGWSEDLKDEFLALDYKRGLDATYH